MFQQKCCNLRGTNSHYSPLSPQPSPHCFLVWGNKERHSRPGGDTEERGGSQVLKRLWGRACTTDYATLTFLKYNWWQFLFEMSQIRNINFSAYFSLIPFLRNKTNKTPSLSLSLSVGRVCLSVRPPRYFVSFAHFFLFMIRVIHSVISARFQTISATWCLHNTESSVLINEWDPT